MKAVCESLADLQAGPDRTVSCGLPLDAGSLGDLCTAHDGLWQQTYPSQYSAVMYPLLYTAADTARISVTDGRYHLDGHLLTAGAHILLQRAFGQRHVEIVDGLLRLTDPGRAAVTEQGAAELRQAGV